MSVFTPESESGACLMYDLVLDAKGLLCPLPVLRAQKVLRDMPNGGLLEVFATDPGAPSDFEDFCRVTASRLVESDKADGVYRFVIQKGA